MLPVRSLILGVFATAMVGLCPFILEPPFHSLTKTFRRSATLPGLDHFKADLEQQIAVTTLAVGL